MRALSRTGRCRLSAAYVRLAKGLDRTKLFAPVAIRGRRGLPGLLFLKLAGAIGADFVRDDSEPARISDLEIPYEAVVAGVRTAALRQLPQRFRRPSTRLLPRITPRLPATGIAPAVANRLWQVALFFDHGWRRGSCSARTS